MVNNILFYSSIISSFAHILLFAFVPNFPQQWLYYTCLTTSIWNHGCKNNWVKWIDRIVVFVGVLHNVYWLSMSFHHTLWSWFGLVFTMNSATFYMVSKGLDDPMDQTLFHLVSHGCATLSNICLGISL